MQFDEALQFLAEGRAVLFRAAIIVATILFALLIRKLLLGYITNMAERRHIDERRTNGICKFTQTMVYAIAIVIVSNVLGFGIQGIFVATSSMFALIGIAFFANWSILSNITASVILYFSFPFRIGDRIAVENEPKFNGILKDVTLFYLRIQNDLGSVITIPANVAIQKIITIQTPKDRERELRELKAARLGTHPDIA